MCYNIDNQKARRKKMTTAEILDKATRRIKESIDIESMEELQNARKELYNLNTVFYKHYDERKSENSSVQTI